jgi:hypothetical protein
MGGAPFSGWTGGQEALLSKRDSLVSSAIVQTLTSQFMGRDMRSSTMEVGTFKLGDNLPWKEVVEWDNLCREIHALPLEDQGEEISWSLEASRVYSIRSILRRSHISRMCGEREYLPRLISFYGNSYGVDCHLVSKWLRDEVRLMDFVPYA